MTDNENKLIELIREQNHPEKALTVAVKTILWHLTQHESSPRPKTVDFQELA